MTGIQDVACSLQQMNLSIIRAQLAASSETEDAACGPGQLFGFEL